MKRWLEALGIPEDVHRLLRSLEDEHVERVGCMSGALAAQLGTVDVQLARLGGLMHDIGKLCVPRRVLLKEGPLSEEEWALMRRHPEEGASLLARLWSECPPEVLEVVRGHHEREGGGGYPQGRVEALCPLTAVVAVADVWDALTSPRVYRRSVLSVGEVQAEMRRQCLPAAVISALPFALAMMRRLEGDYAALV